MFEFRYFHPLYDMFDTYLTPDLGDTAFDEQQIWFPHQSELYEIQLSYAYQGIILIFVFLSFNSYESSLQAWVSATST